jgi:hypothetical protein
MPMVCSVIDGALRSVAAIASSIIALSFILFAAEEVNHASRRQQSEIVIPGSGAAAAKSGGHTAARRAIDDASDVILRPFAGLTSGTHNAWARRGIPALFGLLVYGLGLAYLARRMTVRGHTLVRHAAPPPAGPGDSKPPPGLA